LWGESNAYADCYGYGYTNSNSYSHRDADANFNAVAEGYSDAKACADPAAAPDSLALFGHVNAGTREVIREFPQDVNKPPAQISYAALWSAAVSRRFSS